MTENEGTMVLCSRDNFSHRICFEDELAYCTSPIEVVVGEEIPCADTAPSDNEMNDTHFQVHPGIIPTTVFYDSMSHRISEDLCLPDEKDDPSIVCEPIDERGFNHDNHTDEIPHIGIHHLIFNEVNQIQEMNPQDVAEEGLLILSSEQKMENDFCLMQDNNQCCNDYDLNHTPNQETTILTSTEKTETETSEIIPSEIGLQLVTATDGKIITCGAIIANNNNYNIANKCLTTEKIKLPSVSSTRVKSINSIRRKIEVPKSIQTFIQAGPSRLFKCSECGKAFNTNYSLNCHTRIHTGESPYHCPYDFCGKKFKMSGDLSKHIRSHTGERPYTCDVCGRSFTTCSILKVHKRKHTGEKPYACEQDGCGKKFSTLFNYKNHLRIHKGEKPYECLHEGCGKQFTEYSTLNKHLIVHDEFKPFKCDLCSRSYRQAASLRHHLRTVHKHAADTCGGCGRCSRCRPCIAPRMETDTTHILLQDGQSEMVQLVQVSSEAAPILLLAHSDDLRPTQCITTEGFTESN